VDTREFASNDFCQGGFVEVGREIRVVVVDGREEVLDGVFVDSLDNITGEPVPWIQRRREFSAKVVDFVVVVDGADRLEWILAAVWTVGRYVGLTGLVCIGQEHVGRDFFRACLNYPGACSNANAIFIARPLGKLLVFIKGPLVFLGDGKCFVYLG